MKGLCNHNNRFTDLRSWRGRKPKPATVELWRGEADAYRKLMSRLLGRRRLVPRQLPGAIRSILGGRS